MWSRHRPAKRFLGQHHRAFSFITTPIFYVNSDPHIGHLYTVAIADTLHRWNALKGQEGLFFTGTDEHGLKVQRAATKAGVAPSEFCDKLSKRFRTLFKDFNIKPTGFIKTTESRHKEAVHHFWEKLESNGAIYKDTYSGWYSPSDEIFVAPGDVTDVSDGNSGNKMCKVSGQPVEWVEEDNYRFRLTSFVDEIRHWIENSNVIQPKLYVPEILGMLDKLEDLSVSRQSSRLSWGIPVPSDPSQTVYVWLDALVNYLTLAGYPRSLVKWPPDCQIIGKDIMKFHCIFWPAFLLAHQELKLPEKIFIHSHWLSGNIKMSKSRGNVVDPWKDSKVLTPEGLRYFLVRHQVPQNDTKYSMETAATVINDELYNCLGNLVSRSVVRNLNPSQTFPHFDPSTLHQLNHGSELMRCLESLPEKVDASMENIDFYSAVDLIMSAARLSNTFFHHNTPWKLLKNGQTEQVSAILGLTYESIRLIAILLQPFIPDQSERILNRLGIPKSERTFNHTPILNDCPGPSRCGRPLGETSAELLFKKIQL